MFSCVLYLFDQTFLSDALLWCTQKGQNENNVSVVRLVLLAKPVHRPTHPSLSLFIGRQCAVGKRQLKKKREKKYAQALG